MLNLDQAFAHFPTITTSRLILRQITIADADAHFALFSKPEVVAGHGTEPYTDRSQSEELIGWYTSAFLEQKAIRWAIIHKEEDKFIGTCGLHRLILGHHRAEIGYELDSNYWRQGLGAEAVWGVLRFAFQTAEFHRIEAIVDPENAASAALLRKVGFSEEGFLRERFYDEAKNTFVDDWFFSILKSEFEKIYHLQQSEDQ